MTIVESGGGGLRDVAQGEDVKGLAWLPDGSGIVYGSSRGSTVLYPPTINLRVVRLDGSGDRQITFGDTSYVEPDVHAGAGIAASRIKSQSDIWKVPIDGAPAENAARAAWSRDSRSIYAAIAHTDADIVLLRNAMP